MLQLLEKRDYSPRDLYEELRVSPSLVQRHLKSLLAEGLVDRLGRGPRVFYRFVKSPATVVSSPIIDRHFMLKDPVGNIHYGVEAFLKWSQDNLKKYSLEEKARLYEQCVQDMQRLRKKNGAFSLDGKMDDFHTQTGEEVYLQDVVCAVPYAFPDFGKTKESILLSIAKEGSSQSEEFCDQLVSDFLPILSAYIEREGFDAVVFVPPSASRRVQLMHILRRRFSTISGHPPIVKLDKRHGMVVQQQKHLGRITDRLENADRTFYVRPMKESYDTVLLIDDFIGSGATLNQIAKKLIQQGVAKKVWGIGIVGVRKGFKVVKKV